MVFFSTLSQQLTFTLQWLLQSNLPQQFTALDHIKLQYVFIISWSEK